MTLIKDGTSLLGLLGRKWHNMTWEALHQYLNGKFPRAERVEQWMTLIAQQVRVEKLDPQAVYYLVRPVLFTGMGHYIEVRQKDNPRSEALLQIPMLIDRQTGFIITIGSFDIPGLG